MKKDDLLVLTRDTLELPSKKLADEFISNVDILIEEIAEELETGDKVKIGEYLVIEKKHVDKKEGKTPDGEVYVKEAHDVLKAKLTNKAKELIK